MLDEKGRINVQKMEPVAFVAGVSTGQRQYLADMGFARLKK